MWKLKPHKLKPHMIRPRPCKALVQEFNLKLAACVCVNVTKHGVFWIVFWIDGAFF